MWRGFNHFDINFDSARAIILLSGLSDAEEGLQAFVHKIIEVGEGEVMVNWRKVKRSSNLVADKLAWFGNNCNGNIVIFDTVPDFLVQTMCSDGCGLTGSCIR